MLDTAIRLIRRHATTVWGVIVISTVYLMTASLPAAVIGFYIGAWIWTAWNGVHHTSL